MRRTHRADCDVLFANRRPRSGSNKADFLLATPALGVDIGMMGRLVAFDVELDQPPGRTALLLPGQCAAAVEIWFLEIDEPLEAEFERRTRSS